METVRVTMDKYVPIALIILGVLLLVYWFSVYEDRGRPFFSLLGFRTIAGASLCIGLLNISEVLESKRIRNLLNITFCSGLAVFVLMHGSLLIWPVKTHYYFLDIMVEAKSMWPFGV